MSERLCTCGHPGYPYIDPHVADSPLDCDVHGFSRSPLVTVPLVQGPLGTVIHFQWGVVPQWNCASFAVWAGHDLVSICDLSTEEDVGDLHIDATWSHGGDSHHAVRALSRR